MGLAVGLGMVLGVGLAMGLGMVLGVGVWGSEVFVYRLLCIIRETKVGTETENTEGCLWLSCSSWLIQFDFYTTLTTCLGVAPPTAGWTLSQQSLIKKMPRRNAHRRSSIEVSSCQVSLAYLNWAQSSGPSPESEGFLQTTQPRGSSPESVDS